MIGLGVGIGKLTPPDTGTPIPPSPPVTRATASGDERVTVDASERIIVE